MTWFLDEAFLETLELGAYDAADIAARLDLPLELVRGFVDPARRYWVKSCPDYGWLAGANELGQPTLLFVGSPRLSSENVCPVNAVSFDFATGAIATAAIPVDGELTWDSALDAAEDAIGFIHVGNAPVLAFKHPEMWHYALVPFPFHLHDDVLGKSDGDLSIARDWIERGSFVLHCGNAYYMSAEGDVESS